MPQGFRPERLGSVYVEAGSGNVTAYRGVFLGVYGCGKAIRQHRAQVYARRSVATTTISVVVVPMLAALLLTGVF